MVEVQVTYSLKLSKPVSYENSCGKSVLIRYGTHTTTHTREGRRIQFIVRLQVESTVRDGT